MDPIRLDKARMTKTPLPSLAEEEWEALKAEEAVGGTVPFFFLLTRDKPFPQPQWAFPQKPTIVG